MISPTRWLISTLFLAAIFSAPARGGETEYPGDDESWFILKMEDKKCGHLHATMKRVGDEVHTRTTMKISVQRGSAKLEVKMDLSSREKLDGTPLGFSQTMGMGAIPVTQRGMIRDGKLRLVSEQMGVKKEQTLDFDPGIRLAWGLHREQIRHGLKPGTKFKVKTYEPSLRPDGPVEVELEVVGPEEIDVLGKKRKLTRVVSRMLLPMPMASDSWVDDRGRPVVNTVDLGAMKIKTYEATREQALADDRSPELFFNTLVEARGKLPADARRVRYRLRLPKNAALTMPDIPSTAMQEVRRIGEREVEVAVEVLPWKHIQTVPAGRKPAAGMKEYLRASMILDIDDRRIRSLARRSVKDARSPAEQADALRKSVTKYINHKGMDVGFATASEVVRNRTGDCTEHGVLLAALARAAGLPARGVSGLVAVPGERGDAPTFGYHMWTQVNIDGQWVDVDAAMRQTKVDPTHIALSLMPLNEEGLADAIMTLMPLIGQLEIEIMESQ